jgi:outer membrane protein
MHAARSARPFLILLPALAAFGPVSSRADDVPAEAGPASTAGTGDASPRVTRADRPCDATSDECVAVGRWNVSLSLGLGVRTNPLVGERDIPLVVVPQVSYYGDHFFLDNLDFGWTLGERRSSSWSLIATPGYDRVFFDRSDPQNFFIGTVDTITQTTSPSEAAAPAQMRLSPGHPEVTYLAGPEWTFVRAGVTGQVDALHEITGHNHGNEVRAALGLPLVDGVGSLVADVGFTWKSAAIVDYFYGVPGSYQPGAAVNPFLKIGYSAPLRAKWRLTAFVHEERLGDAIAQSPIVAQRYVLTVFAGATRVF